MQARYPNLALSTSEVTIYEDDLTIKDVLTLSAQYTTVQRSEFAAGRAMPASLPSDKVILNTPIQPSSDIYNTLYKEDTNVAT